MANHSLLILPGVASQGGGKLFHLGCCNFMPSSQRLHSQWDKGNTLLPTYVVLLLPSSFSHRQWSEHGQELWLLLALWHFGEDG